MTFCNINFNLKNKDDLFELAGENKTKIIITVNAQFIVEANNSKRFFELLENNYNTFDGTIPLLTAKFLSFFKFIPS